MSIGMPASIDDVLAQYTLPAEAVNAADSLRAAIPLLVRPHCDALLPEEKQHLIVKGDYELKGGAALPEESIKVLDAYLAENAPALKFIDEALAHTHLQFATPLEPLDDSLALQMAGFDQALDLLCMRGIQHAVHDRQVEVEAALLQMLQIAEMEYWDAEPTKQMLPGLAVERFAILFDDALHRFRLSPECLNQIGDRVSRLDARQTLQRILVSHSAAIARDIYLLRQDAACPFGKSRFYQRDADWTQLYANCMWGYALVTGYADAWHAESLYVLRNLHLLSANKSNNLLVRLNNLNDSIQSQMVESNNLFAPRFTFLLLFSLVARRMDGVLSVSRLACALERHNLETGDLPDSLDSLTVKLTDGEIADHFTGEPIQYKRTDDGYQIGSSGHDMNCEDCAESFTLPDAGVKQDFVLSVHRPDLAENLH